MTLSYEAIQKAFTRVLIKNAGKDPLTLAEKLADRLEILIDDCDEGDGIPPLSITRERGEAPAPRANLAPPLPAGKSAIILPTDREFREAVEAHSQEKVRPGGLVLSKIGQPSDRRQAKLWTYETMVEALMSGTPDKFFFRPDGTPEGTQVLAQRNILTLQGTETVRLMYANPQMGDDSIQPGDISGGGKCSISLQATVTFTLFDESLDIPAAMESIMTQCRGLYRVRNKTMTPDAGPEPGPLRIDMSESPMGAAEGIRLESDWKIIDAPGSAKDRVVQMNRQTGNH